MSRRLLPAVLAAAAFLLAACGVESKNPLSTAATSTIDSRLEGIYDVRREKPGDELEGWHFHYRGAKATASGQPRVTPFLEVLHVAHANDGGLKVEVFHVLTAKLGGRDYLSFRSASGKGQDSFYSFMRYEVSWSGNLHVWAANSNFFAKAIKAGKLHGTVKHHGALPDDIYLTDSTERLAAFVVASDPTASFGGKPLVFHRLAR